MVFHIASKLDIKKKNCLFWSHSSNETSNISLHRPNLNTISSSFSKQATPAKKFSISKYFVILSIKFLQARKTFKVSKQAIQAMKLWSYFVEQIRLQKIKFL